MNATTVSAHPATIDAYIRHGWSLVPIPPGTKGPNAPNWNRKERAIKGSGEIPPSFGIGLAHAYSGTMALDIDEWDSAAAMLMLHGIDLSALFDAPDAVTIHSGNPGHGKLLYAMPFGMVLRSKKITHDGRVIYELRCGTANGLTVQDVLPPSMHPGTGQPYRWGGKGNWQNLPVIPMPLFDYWHSVLNAEDLASVAIVTGDAVPSNWTEIQDALNYISPDCSRDEWVQVGMALHYAGVQANDPATGLRLWDEWSKQSHTKYPGDRQMSIQWASFRPDKTHIVKLGTLFHYAHKGGWTRRVDATALFAPVKFEQEASVTDLFMPAPPKVDLSLWPDLLAARAREVSDGIGCDIVLPLMGGLCAASGAIDARTRLELLPGYKVPPLIWAMTIGEPGDKKSPGSQPMIEPLLKIENEDTPRYQKAMAEFEGREAFHAVAKKAWLDAASSPEALLNNQVPQPPERPETPVKVRLRVQDATSQKLVRLCADRPRGVLVHLDEMASWLDKMSNSRSGEDRSCWVQLYESKPYTMDRVGSGTVHAENMACAFFGNIQPQIFKKLLPDLSNDGLIQRFIPVVPDFSSTRLGNPVPACMTRESEWENTLRMLYALPTMEYRLSAGAYDVFRRFQAQYERRKQDERLTRAGYAYMTAFGKLEGTCGRLALVMHMIESPWSTEVSAALMERVVRIVWGMVVPSLRYAYSVIGGTSEFDSWLGGYIVQVSDLETISLRELATAGHKFMAGLAPREVDSMIYAGMALLERAQWVKRVDDGSREHARVAQWAINPALRERFKKRNDELSAAKKRLADMDRASQDQHLHYG